MTENAVPMDQVDPQIRRCASGGWLAVFPRKLGLSFGVTATTEREVRDEFSFALARWL